MVKVGLITFHDTTNFGSFLQTLGLYKAIEFLGYDCEVIDYRCEAIENAELPARNPSSLSLKAVARFLIFEPIKRKKYSEFRKELSKKIKLSDQYTKNSICDANDKFDIFVSGSDILWDLKITGGDTSYLLDFVDINKGQIAFGTSIGAEWNDDLKVKLRPLVEKYDNIALRESSSAKWMKNLINKDVLHVCDPTMLMDEQYWMDYADKSSNREIYSKHNYVLVYFSSDYNIEEANIYASQRGCEVWVINYGRCIKGVKNIRPFSISDFLSIVKNAEALFTSSYHGMLFSIYFQVPFFVYLREETTHNERFVSLLEKLDLVERIRIKNKNKSLFNEINFNRSSEIIDMWRRESLELLNKYLLEGYKKTRKGI